MRPWATALVVVAMIGVTFCPTGAAGDDPGNQALRARLIAELDAHLDQELVRLRAELRVEMIHEIDEALAERKKSPAADLPDGYDHLLREIAQAEADLAKKERGRMVPAKERPAEKSLLGARVEAAPGVLVAQLHLAPGAVLLTKVPEGSRARTLGLREGDVVLTMDGGPPLEFRKAGAPTRCVVLRQGKKIVLPEGEKTK